MNSAPQSIWINETYLQKWDYLILGNGFTGIQTAIQLKLKHPKAKIAIADKNHISDGASLRNAGFACFGSVSEIIDDIQSTNKKDVFDLVAMRFNGLKYLQKDFKHFDYQKGNAHEIFLDSETAQYQKSIEHLSMVNKEMLAITGEKETYKTQSQTYNSSFKPLAISNSLEGHLHTGKLYHRMQQKAIALGIFWIANINVTAINGNNPVSIFAENGQVLESQVVISCLNAFTPHLFPKALLVPARGQIIVTQPLKQKPLKGILHADKGYIYARNLGNRILIGGGRNIDLETEKTFEFKENPKISGYLLNFVNQYLLKDEVAQIDQQWSCIMGISPKKGGLPIIKEEMPHVWSCYRLGGMGVALSAIVARKMMEKL